LVQDLISPLEKQIKEQLADRQTKKPQQQCQVVEEEQLEGSWQRKQEVLIKEQRKARRELLHHLFHRSYIKFVKDLMCVI
jgi:hypothetical protein